MKAAAPWQVAGLQQRKRMPRPDLAALAERKFDPVDVLRAACHDRVPELVPFKFKLMCSSPFVFYRGSVEIMAADLAAGKRTGIAVQLCGDAHVKNFGFFASPASDVVLDINDFDQTWRGPWEWDVKRMVTSIVLAGREAGDGDSRCKAAARIFTEEYCRWIRHFAALTTLEVVRHRVYRDFRDPVMREALAKAERDTPVTNLQKLTRTTSHGRQLRTRPGVQWQIEGKTRKAVLASVEQYRHTLAPEHQLISRRYAPVDVGFKVVGTGSIGTRDYVVYCRGYDQDDPVFLQIKEEPPSVYAAYLNDARAPANQGERVVRGQRMLQVLSDMLLGWCSVEGRDYLVRQLSDHKSSIDPAELSGQRLEEYSRVCAELLAKGHARSGDVRQLAAYLGSSEKAPRALAQFGAAYADCVEADYNLFCKAVRQGRLSATARKR